MENELSKIEHEIEQDIEHVVDLDGHYWVPVRLVSGDAYSPAREGLTIEPVRGFGGGFGGAFGTDLGSGSKENSSVSLPE